MPYCWKKLLIIHYLWPKRLKTLRTLWDCTYRYVASMGVSPGTLSWVRWEGMSHHLTVCFASQRNTRQTSFMANNVGTFRRKGRVLVLWVTKREMCTRFDRSWYGLFLEGFLALSFDFLHFIHESTIGFSVHNYFLFCISNSLNFLRKSGWQFKRCNDCRCSVILIRFNSAQTKSMGGFFNFNIEMKWVFLAKSIDQRPRGWGFLPRLLYSW